MATYSLITLIARSFEAWNYCKNASGLGSMQVSHEEDIEAACRDLMPSGSGVDSGTQFDFAESRVDRLVFRTSFHHMNSGGMYDGWTEHRVIVSPSLGHGFTVEVKGRNRDGIKDYLADLFYEHLRQEVADHSYYQTDDTFSHELPRDLQSKLGQLGLD